jgi:AcrR family transcriptional regulator
MGRKSTEERQVEIKTAVLQIISSEGIKSVSTKNIAKQTGLSEGAIFRHFKSKRDIMISIIDDVSENMIEKLKDISLENTSARDRLYRVICKTISYLTENNGITILLFTEASQANDVEMMEKLNYLFKSQTEIAAKIINDGIDESIWNKNISVEDVSTLYMGIPITNNIKLILFKEEQGKDFCKRMMNLFELILRPNEPLTPL